MATDREPPRDVVDARYRAKVAARASGKVPVFEHLAPIDGTSDAPAAVEARFRQKMARHNGQVTPAASEPAGEQKPKAAEAGKADAGDGKKAEPAGEQKRRGG